MAHGNEVRGEDSITKQLLKIIRVNNALVKLKKTNAIGRVRNAAKRLQEECGNYLYRSKNNPEGCIAERLRKKEGRMRGTLMGKRCKFHRALCYYRRSHITYERRRCTARGGR